MGKRIAGVASVTASVTLVLLTTVVSGCGGGGSSKATTTKPHKLTQVELVRKVSRSTIEVWGKEGDNVYGGTGIVIDAKQGLALTNAHVVSGMSAIHARYKEEDTAAQVIGVSPCEDVALLRITSVPEGLQPIKFGTARHIVSGQQVTAIGYPGTFQENVYSKPTATTGIVSVDGTVAATVSDDLPRYSSVIEHQATVNPGNSGGPLVNGRGELVGMNSLHNVGSGGETQNQGYAISVDHIKQLLPQLKSRHFISYIGWDLIPYKYLTAADKNSLGYRYVPKPAGSGLVVLGVDPGSPADRRHFSTGDWIYEIDGTSVNTVQDVCQIAQSHEGEIIKVTGSDLKSDTPFYIEKVRVK